MMRKLASRKFLMALAAFLSATSAEIFAFKCEDHWLLGCAIIGQIASAGIYAAVEAYVDAHNATRTSVYVEAKEK